MVPIAIVQGAPVVYTQSDWNVEDSNAQATVPFSGWDQYGSKNQGVVAGSDIHLQSVNYTLIRESDDGSTDICSAQPSCPHEEGGFNAGTFIDTMADGTGGPARVILKSVAGDGGTVGLFGNGGIVKSNLATGTQVETINALATDGTHLYAAGYDMSQGTDSQWHIEKYDALTSGGLDTGFNGTGIVIYNKNNEGEAINAIAVDAAYIYVAGYNHVTVGDEQWRIEKRDKTDGSLVGAFQSGGTLEIDITTGPSPEQATAIAVDATHVYIAGYDHALGNSQWRVEKRDINNGNPDGTFGTGGVYLSNPSAGDDRITAMAQDATYIYVAGYDRSNTDAQWRVEKIKKADGTLEAAFDTDGIIVSNPGIAEDDLATAIAVDSAFIYVGGYDKSQGDYQWRVEKFDIINGNPDTNFGTNGVVTTNPSVTRDDRLLAMVIDTDYIYTAGYDLSMGVSNPEWRIECLGIMDGSPMTAFGNNGAVDHTLTIQNAEKINALALNGIHLFAAGYDFSQGDPKWRIEKRFARLYKSNGTFESAVIDLGGVQDFTTINWQSANPSPLSLTMEGRAGNTATPDVSWTAWTPITAAPAPAPGVFDDNRYFQYRASLSTGDTRVTASLDGFNLQFSNYPVGTGLTSSVFDTGTAANFLKTISWTEIINNTILEDIRLQIATSPDNVTWNYCGENACSSGWLPWNDYNNYYTTAGMVTNLESSDAIDDRYFQYRVWFVTNGTTSPSIDDIAITFDTASLKVFDPSGAASTFAATAGVPFNIVLKVEDSSGVSFTDHDGSSTVRLTALGAVQPDMGSCTSSFSGSGNTTMTTGVTYASGTATITGVVLCGATSTGFDISAQETNGGALSSTSDLTISSVSLDNASLQLAFGVAPAPTYVAATDFNPAPTVHVQDQYGNIDTTDSTTAVTLAAYSDATCSTTAVGVFTATALGTSSGVATFSNVNYDRADTIYIGASGGALPSACYGPVGITGSGYTVQIDPIYDTANDNLVISTALLHNGGLVSDYANMSLTRIEILDDATTTVVSLPAELSTGADTTNSIFHTTWNPATALSTSVTYRIEVDLTYNGTIYSAFNTINIGLTGVITADLQQLGTKMTGVETTVTSIDTKTGTVDTKVIDLDTKLTGYESNRAAFRSQTASYLSDISQSIGTILEDTSKTLPDLLQTNIQSELAKGAHSEIVTTQATVKTGSTLPFRFRTASGLKPTITVFDPENVPVIVGADMKEVGGTGIYITNVTFNTAWGLGNFMLRVDETTNQSVDHIVLNVIEVEEPDQKKKKGIGASAITIDTLYSRMNKIDSTVSNLTSSVATVRSNTQNVGTDIDKLLDKVTKGTAGGTNTEDPQKLSQYLNNVNSIIGTGGASSDYRTIMGKLNTIETTLSGIGQDSDAAVNFNQNAKAKAEKIKKFVTLVMAEMDAQGKVDNPEEKIEIIEEYLADLKTTVEEIPESITTDEIAVTVTSTLEELGEAAEENETVKELIPMVEPELTKVTEVKTAEDLTPTDLQDMRNDVSGLKSLMLEIRGLLDTEVNKPVVHGWLEGN